MCTPLLVMHVLLVDHHFTPIHSTRQRLGPGGLDPVEVFETLPEAMKEAFAGQDPAALQRVIADMGEEAVLPHLEKCVLSGLWIPAEDSPLAALLKPKAGPPAPDAASAPPPPPSV